MTSGENLRQKVMDTCRMEELADSLDNNEDMIDSRDITDLIEHFEDKKVALDEAIEEAECELSDARTELDNDDGEDEDYMTTIEEALSTAEDAYSAAKEELQDFKDEYGDKLDSLKKLAEEGESAATDWTYGECMIRESYFTEYSMQSIKDCGELPQDIPSYIEIDEEKTAENLKQDYQEIDFDGVTYYIR